jgi:hypothetical protein
VNALSVGLPSCEQAISTNLYLRDRSKRLALWVQLASMCVELLVGTVTVVLFFRRLIVHYQGTPTASAVLSWSQGTASTQRIIKLLAVGSCGGLIGSPPTLLTGGAVTTVDPERHCVGGTLQFAQLPPRRHLVLSPCLLNWSDCQTQCAYHSPEQDVWLGHQHPGALVVPRVEVSVACITVFCLLLSLPLVCCLHCLPCLGAVGGWVGGGAVHNFFHHNTPCQVDVGWRRGRHRRWGRSTAVPPHLVLPELWRVNSTDWGAWLHARVLFGLEGVLFALAPLCL